MGSFRSMRRTVSGGTTIAAILAPIGGTVVTGMLGQFVEREIRPETGAAFDRCRRNARSIRSSRWEGVWNNPPSNGRLVGVPVAAREGEVW